ncbi:hypothetical protein EDB89DRAFT_2169334 [Lactarius sanguifluus]|nr:hypothetical protein EDB89DRAFT_2169334 [Lactarius sanguifluus]
MASLMGGDFGTEELDQVLSTQLDALAISPQATQNIIPALLGIAKLAKVQLQCASTSTSFSQPMVSEPEPELMDSNAKAKTGHLYVHCDTSRNTFLYWILTTANRWERVSSGAEHPLNHDQVLPSRLMENQVGLLVPSRVSTVTTKTRKEKEIRENPTPSTHIAQSLSHFTPLVTAKMRTGSLAQCYVERARKRIRSGKGRENETKEGGIRGVGKGEESRIRAERGRKRYWRESV